MASVLAGFRPVKHRDGSPYNGQVNRYIIPSAETTAVNVGDLVILSDSDPGEPYAAVERATGTTAVVPIGVVVGFEPFYENLNVGNFRPASTKRIALVADSPDLIFAAPQDGVGGNYATASIGLNTTLVAGSPQTVVPYASQMKLDSSEVNTTNTWPFRIVGFTDSPDREEAGRIPEVLVTINTHRWGSGPGVAGV
jgi:hypothetical protein